jgi:hypothetical protein
MSEVKVNKISPRTNCGTVTLGDSGDTFSIPAGVTLTNSGTATGFGPTGAVSWDTSPKTTTVTAASGVGYFVDTTLGVITVNLPAGSAGSIVAISDYANTAATNNITITPNGTDKIDGVNASYYFATDGAAITLIYVDSTIGWKDVNDSTLNAVGTLPAFITATGGTILTCGDFKTHVFTGPGTFTVSCAGNVAGSNSVEYLVVAGGGGGGFTAAGGGGAGGYRQNYPSPITAGLSVTAQGYPITVGGGGGGAPGTPGNGVNGNNSVFSSITSAGGGGGASGSGPGGGGTAQAGGSGGGGAGGTSNSGPAVGGAGNTPPVAPPQGNAGGTTATPGGAPVFGGSGGGGAGGIGGSGSTTVSGNGGEGSSIVTTFFGPTAPSYGTTGPAPGRYFAGGGGGSADTATGGPGTGGSGGGGNGGIYFVRNSASGAANTGGGGGGSCFSEPPQSGGSGIVAIRYKFQ